MDIDEWVENGSGFNVTRIERAHCTFIFYDDGGGVADIPDKFYHGGKLMHVINLPVGFYHGGKLMHVINLPVEFYHGGKLMHVINLPVGFYHGGKLMHVINLPVGSQACFQTCLNIIRNGANEIPKTTLKLRKLPGIVVDWNDLQADPQLENCMNSFPEPFHLANIPNIAKILNLEFNVFRLHEIVQKSSKPK